MTACTVVSREDWLAACNALLAKEKAMTRQLDALRAERRKLPWVKVDKAYTFASTGGQISLAAGRSDPKLRAIRAVGARS